MRGPLERNAPQIGVEDLEVAAQIFQW